jgi:hypothetical protein
MSFRAWEEELGPEVTGIGKPMSKRSDAELDARISEVGGHLLGVELEEIESDRMTPDEVSEEARRSAEFFKD